MPRFVILEHEHLGTHWDFMLESGDSLRTWRLESMPRTGERITATALADHRPIYLEYEGPISGGRGVVRRWDQGQFQWQAKHSSRLELTVTGVRLQGRVAMWQMDSGGWVFEFAERDR